MKTSTIFKIIFLLVVSTTANAQNCPVNSTTILLSNPDTYYPGTRSVILKGARNIALGAAGAGSTPIATGDLLLIIQMQGAQITSSNNDSYGDGIGGGAANGYLNNSALQAGNMEYIVATNTVPLSGGTLSILTGTINAYKNAAYGTDGQYRYQIIRIGVFYNLTLAATISAPNWDGNSGGVLVLSVTNNLNFNGQKLSAAAAGFRGGGARQLSGGSGGLNTDLVTLSTQNYNASKAEGIAGTPRFVNNHGVIFDNGVSNEGYPNGSYAAGAPGNAGGGGTDGNPGSNDQNSGGGGGGNGGAGGRGGNSWSSNLVTGGQPAAIFAQNTASRLVMGGGGGAGTTNNGTGSAAAGFSSSGAAGGGIVLLTANAVTGTGTIDVSGENAFLTVLNDGSGGGGAGGSALVYAGNGWSNITVLAGGGTGGTNTGTGSPHGPGGGGGGGVIYCNGTLNAASTVAPGTAGYTALGTTHFNSTTGTTGVLVQNVTKAQVPNQFLYCTVLPLNFIGISAAWEANNVIVNWQTANETVGIYYTIEKSTDGITFTAAGSTSNTHSFLDTKNTNSGTTYYRVKETGLAGEMLYSTTVTIKPQQITGTLFSVSPNPAINSSASIHFTVKNPGGASVMLRMVSMSGVTIWQNAYRVTGGSQTVMVENLDKIPNGTYFIQYAEGLALVNTKLVIQH